MPPKLRNDLLLRPTPGDPDTTQIYDPTRGALFAWDRTLVDIAQRLDGTTPLTSLADALDDWEVEHLEQLVQQLESLGLLERPDDGPLPTPRVDLRKMLGIFTTEDVSEQTVESVAVREGLRYGCMCCGACCRGRFVVPLTPNDEERLLALDLEGTLGISREHAITDTFELGPTGVPLRFLNKDERGFCVFLGDDGLCQIHAHFGADAKPILCRSFPFEPLMTPEGPILRFKPECSRQHLSLQSGPLVAPGALERFQRYVEEDPEIATIPSRFPLSELETTTYRAYHALEQRWDHTLRQHGVNAFLAQASERLELTLDDNLWRQLGVAGVLLHTHELETTADVPITPDTLRDVLDGPVPHVPELEPLLQRYLQELLFGKYLFYGHRIDAGLAVVWFVVQLVRACTPLLEDPEDPTAHNELILHWHLTVYGRHSLRVWWLEALR